MIISLYAGGMTLRDIQHHLASTIGTEISHETISKIVDQIGEEILIWQQRPLEALYPVIFLDAIVVKVRDGGHVRNKAAHLAIGIGMEGIKHVLGIWVQANQGTTFWAAVCAELAAFEATELGRRYPSTSKAFRDARGAVHALPRVPARTAARDLYDQLDRVAQPPAAEDHPGTAATSQTITRSSSCSGWRSATSKTNERATGRKSEVSAPSNAKHPDASSRARSRRTGNRHCNSSHWSTPTASTPTSDHHDRERLHKELDRL